MTLLMMIVTPHRHPRILMEPGISVYLFVRQPACLLVYICMCVHVYQCVYLCICLCLNVCFNVSYIFRCAGLIAAGANNGICGVGVAYGARVSGEQQ